MNSVKSSSWGYKMVETGRKLQGGIKETAYQIHVEGNEFDVIANVDTDSSKARGVANLISASPDLLASLRQVMVWIDDWEPEFTHDPYWAEDRYKVRSAILKALGGQV